MANVHIVIPAYNNWALTHKMLWDLHKHERENISSILVVDDCSTDEEVLGGLKWWIKEAELLPLYQKLLPQNVGFLRASNEGLKICEKLPDDDIVILLSNDVQIMSKFISQNKMIMEDNPKSLVGGVLYTHDTGWNTIGSRTFPYLEGWYLSTSVAGWRDLGYFDERFSPCDFEDVDISTTAIEKGYQLVPLNNPGIKHMGGQTLGYTPERAERTRINQKKFEAKWLK